MTIVDTFRKDKKTVFSAVIGLLVLLLLVFNYSFLTGFSRYRSLGGQLKKFKSGKAGVGMLADRSVIFDKEISGLNTEVKGLKEKLFWDMGISGFLNELTRLAEDLPIDFVAITPQVNSAAKNKEKTTAPLAIDERYEEIFISVDFKGGFEDIVEFLTRIENTGKLIRIHILDVQAAKQYGDKHNVKILVSIFGMAASG